MIRLKRAWDNVAEDDGARYLVDRLWPRGVKKDDLAIAGWLKDVAPSNELRRWFHGEDRSWDEFRRRYAREIDAHPEALAPLLDAARAGNVTLVYAGRDRDRNNATVLREILEQRLDTSTSQTM